MNMNIDGNAIVANATAKVAENVALEMWNRIKRFFKDTNRHNNKTFFLFTIFILSHSTTSHIHFSPSYYKTPHISTGRLQKKYVVEIASLEADRNTRIRTWDTLGTNQLLYAAELCSKVEVRP